MLISLIDDNLERNNYHHKVTSVVLVELPDGLRNFYHYVIDVVTHFVFNIYLPSIAGVIHVFMI